MSTKVRAHSKYSASGAEMWFNCPGSVHLQEGIPSKDSIYSIEGTQAHDVLEALLKFAAEIKATNIYNKAASNLFEKTPQTMINHGVDAANFILNLHKDTPGSELGFEEKVYLDFIDPEMFGTYDARVVEVFGTLHVFDYKYGAGHAVSPKKNLQMIFYAIGLAAKYHWNFQKVRLWIIQPRIKGYDGPLFWDLEIEELLEYVESFKDAIDRVKTNPKLYKEGSWCHWCRAKFKCPVKQDKKLNEAKNIFTGVIRNGKKESNPKKEGGPKARQAKEIFGKVKKQKETRYDELYEEIEVDEAKSAWYENDENPF